MEFDNNLKFKEIDSLKVSSVKDLESFAADVWHILNEDSRQVGDAGNAEYWADYSTSLFTRHLVCKVSQVQGSEEGGQNLYEIRFSAGQGLGRIGDVLMMLLLLLFFYMLSKSFSAQLLWYYPVLCAVCAVIALTVLYLSRKCRFGSVEVSRLSERMSHLS